MTKDGPEKADDQEKTAADGSGETTTADVAAQGPPENKKGKKTQTKKADTGAKGKSASTKKEKKPQTEGTRRSSRVSAKRSAEDTEKVTTDKRKKTAKKA